MSTAEAPTTSSPRRILASKDPNVRPPSINPSIKASIPTDTSTDPSKCTITPTSAAASFPSAPAALTTPAVILAPKTNDQQTQSLPSPTSKKRPAPPTELAPRSKAARLSPPLPRRAAQTLRVRLRAAMASLPSSGSASVNSISSRDAVKGASSENNGGTKDFRAGEGGAQKEMATLVIRDAPPSLPRVREWRERWFVSRAAPKRERTLSGQNVRDLPLERESDGESEGEGEVDGADDEERAAGSLLLGLGG